MLGIIIAIACAFTWSLSVILLKIASNHVHPIVLNLGKNTLGLALLIPTAYLVDGPLPEISTLNLTLLFLSGFFGIGIADAMVLKAMNLLTASKVAILECLFAPFVITLSVIFFGETINFTQGLGVLAIGASLFLVLPKKGSQAKTENSLKGSILMSLGLLTMAGGILIVKPMFEEVPLFWIITIRMVAGVLGSLPPMFLLKHKRAEILQLWGMQRKFLVFIAFFLSAYVSISLWIAGYKYLQASVASVLNQTSTIFTVILAVVVLKEEFTTRKAVAAILATVGVVIISAH
ncbi:DMT family transporter [Pseudobacteriovorax antillogorgiicola]|uniref:Uncharacterized membrane protein n=1 Tax=Pseudobacteriovorax antillogorgiicola TaxID=1513793 RepID=A0A1Y6BUM6_9BACT|nr:DMT family transporter [Pseudobacteriovorax antillogorgiicola]TCS52374.1 putative membrane protein [Pseudobacteriovorax antillogorgiicola]SMF29326.1 Uncharacterized membrane protein [Pseudobacteriovorax antillogorgiicola]